MATITEPLDEPVIPLDVDTASLDEIINGDAEQLSEADAEEQILSLSAI